VSLFIYSVSVTRFEALEELQIFSTLRYINISLNQWWIYAIQAKSNLKDHFVILFFTDAFNIGLSITYAVLLGVENADS